MGLQSECVLRAWRERAARCGVGPQKSSTAAAPSNPLPLGSAPRVFNCRSTQQSAAPGVGPQKFFNRRSTQPSAAPGVGPQKSATAAAPSHPLPLPQMDFLEHPAITDVVVCKTVLEEVRVLVLQAGAGGGGVRPAVGGRRQWGAGGGG